MSSMPSAVPLPKQRRDTVPAIQLVDNQWFSDSLGVFVQGASYLLGGAPGSRKSGLAAQLALDLARQGKTVLTIPTEEPEPRVWDRFYPMLSGIPATDITRAMIHLRVEANPPSIDQLPSYVSRQILSPNGSHHFDVKMVIIDSVQGHGLVSSATKAYDRVLETTRLLSSAGITTLLVNQLTKRGELAGPRTLEHGVDGVLLLRKTPSCRLMFTIKNRYGPANLREPAALVLDPVTLRLVPTPLASAVHAAATTYLGAGSGPVEVQASVGLAGYGIRGRVTAPGLPKAEIQQLVASIAQLPGIEIDDMDFSISCRLPGRRRYGSSFGLALAMSLLASYLRRPMPSRCLFLGEVGLGRDIQPIEPRLVNDLIADLAAAPEMVGSWRIFCHPKTVNDLTIGGIDSNTGSIKIVPCQYLETALYNTWPELR